MVAPPPPGHREPPPPSALDSGLLTSGALAPGHIGAPPNKDDLHLRPRLAGQELEDWVTKAEEDVSHEHKKVEFMVQHAEGWFHAETNRLEQLNLARIHMQHICASVDELTAEGMLPDGRWTNDPDACPMPNLPGTMTANALTPFPAHDGQYFLNGVYKPLESKLRPTALPCHELHSELGSVWLRLVDFAPSAMACQLFDECVQGGTHCGKVLQGALDNGYFVEALQAISLRPRLCKQLFYCWDTRRSVYIARIFKSGTWMRVEVDDFVPVGSPPKGDLVANAPICCRSDSFPFVMWPSLVEKAYAKVHTFRSAFSHSSPADSGGWEALDGGGRTEEALADLTGGVAGRFRTSDVSADRLFIYIHELQRDTLFVCRVNEPMCDGNGVSLNPYYPNVVNRAVVWEGRTFVQMFCGAPGVYDGGLQDNSVPWSLINSTEYPERTSQGYFWITAQDFHAYYDTIFECRLVNSGDVSIVNMPPPRLPGFMPMLLPGMPLQPGLAPGMPMPGMLPGMAPGMMPPMMMQPQMRGTGMATLTPAEMSPDADPQHPWFESVHATGGMVCRFNEPEFMVQVPDGAVPCEIVCCLEQVDARLSQQKAVRKPAAAVLLKVYEQVDGQSYNADLVCRSNWIPCRDSMVAFCALRGGDFRIVAEMPRGTLINRMIFRCYSQRPNVTVTAAASAQKHFLVNSPFPPRAVKFTFVGCIRPERYASGQLQTDEPEVLDLEHDSMRKPEMDLATPLSDLVDEVRQDCVLM
eukprot:TRINITY_DN110929_c0_g1_i1.p1 TRINITY_DN110929_c0_g1~~TRINITY_DN110929_c0_g1_i1.p1  ORF type:complete len:753 (-),score=136.07 TRINITY_DN110929_c0_g1_i1:109-2367(-)